MFRCHFILRSLDRFSSSYHNVIIRDFNGSDEHPSDFALDEFLLRLIYAKVLLDYVISLTKDKDLTITALKDKITILTAKESAKSYRIGSGGSWEVSNSLNDEAKKETIDDIMGCHNKIKQLDPTYKVPQYGYKGKEIAAELGISKSHVSNLITRAQEIAKAYKEKQDS